MTRKEFVATLDLLVRRGDITPEEKIKLISMFDAGQLAPDGLWLQAGRATSAKEEDRSHALLLAALILDKIQRQSLPSEALIDALQDMASLQIKDLMATSMPAQEWHDRMAKILIATTLASAAAADIENYGRSGQGQLEEAITEQLRWLYLFAASKAVRAALGRPWSQAYLAARAIRYLGEARAQFYQAFERSLEGDGYVVDYVAVDDPATCTPCQEAEAGGPYLPGDGPWPGQICEGGGFCRCRRVQRFDPATAAELAAGR